jgi:aerobic-type carbon monoxide dehydrogenase small subunit (CoxS/CutS family)
MNVSFELNGRNVAVETRPNRTLLDLIRDELGVTSVKNGCQQGECGACTLLLDGIPVTSCMVLAPQVEGRKVKTLEGLEEDPLMKKLQEAYVENGAVQCGYCTPGMLISSYALLRENPTPTEDEIKIAIEGNICRCTGYTKIIAAIGDAAERMAPE